jgi:hypothetical protein
MDGTSYYSNSALQRMGHIPTPRASGGVGQLQAFSSPGGPSFKDVLDIINPLQHIPVVNTLYRHLTGDTEGAVADVLGGALYGGPVGAVLAVGDDAIKDSTGASVSDHAWAMLFGGPTPDGSSPTAIVKAAPASPAPAVAGATPAAAIQLASAEPPAPSPAGQTPAVTAQQLAPQGHSDSIPQQQSAASNAPVDLLAARSSSEIGNPARYFAGPVSPASASQAAPSVPGVTMQGGYMVFGPGAASALTARDIVAQGAKPDSKFAVFDNSGAPNDSLPAAAAAPAATAASAAPAATAAAIEAATPTATPVSLTSADAALAAGGHVFAPPPRNNSLTPKIALPPPTTGPGALPGHASISVNAAAAQANGAAQGSSSDQWFAKQFNQAMDKYQAAAKLGTIVDPVSALAAPSSPVSAAGSY